MATQQIVYEDTVGLILNINFNIDIDGATNAKLYCKKPDGSEAVWTATVSGTRQLTYTTQEGDLVCGVMKIQPWLTLGTWSGFGSVIQLRVNRKFE